MAVKPQRTIVLLALVVSILLSLRHVSAATTCPPLGSQCPLGRSEVDSPDTPLRECSGHGACVLGACQCDPGFADVDCGATFRRTKLASIFITQGGFDDGPTRYFDIITQVVELLKQEGDFSIPAQDILSECRVAMLQTPDVPLSGVDIELIEDSIRVKLLNGGIQTSGKVHMIIPNVPIDAAVSTVPFINTCCDNNQNPLQTSTFGCAVACASSEGAQVAFEMDVTFSINLFPSFDRDTGTITVNVPENQVQVSFDPPDMGMKLNCNLSPFPDLLFQLVDRFVISIGSIVAGQVVIKAREVAAEISATAFAGLPVNITENLSLRVFVPFGEFVANSHMEIEVEGLFIKQRFPNDTGCPSVETIVVDRTLVGNLVPNPNSLRDFFWQDDNNEILRTLFAGRLARAALTSGLKAILLDDSDLSRLLTSIRTSFGILDANFEGALDMSLPRFGFPANSTRSKLGDGDFLEVSLEAGSARLICNDTGEDLFAASFKRGAINLRPLLIGELSDFEAAFIGSSNANFKATLEVFDLDLSTLNLSVQQPINASLPNSLVVAAMDVLLGGSKMEAANDLLRSLALPIPPELAKLMPGPRIEALHDSSEAGSDGRNGFFQFSTRCLCLQEQDADNDELFFVIQSEKFGEEVVPRCLTPCTNIVLATSAPTTARRGLRDQSDGIRTPTLMPARDFYMKRGRYLQAESPSNDYESQNISDPLIIQSCDVDITSLKTVTRAILTCSQRLDASSTASLQAKTQCMNEIASELESDESVQSASPSGCSEENILFSVARKCEAPVGLLMEELFAQACKDGPAFQCSDTLASVLTETCTCFDSTDGNCSDSAMPLLILGIGWAVPFSVLMIVGLWLRTVEGCCLSRYVGTQEEKAVLFFKVHFTKQDKYFVGLGGLTVLALGALSVGWVFDDPIRAFLSEALEQDVFKHTIWVRTNFDEFALGWSLAILFSFAFTGSSLLAMVLYSIVVGRCVWMVTHPNQAYLKSQKGEMFIPSPSTATLWSRNAQRLQWVNRFSVFVLATSIFAPPVFFQVHNSVQVIPPQFDPFIDQSNREPEDLMFANLTSLATSTEVLEALGISVGFTLMSSFLGFLSSLVLLIVQGMVPAAFCIASVALHWLDLQMKVNGQHGHNQDRHQVLTSHDSRANQTRWRWALHFFIWSAHSGGALGSLIGAILVYQTLRAPVVWAVIWILGWNLTIPLIVLLVRTKNDQMAGKRRLILSTTYASSFLVLSIILVSLAPVRVSFASPLAIVFLAAIFLYSLTILLAEYCNLGSESTAVLMGGGRHILQGGGTLAQHTNGFEIGYTYDPDFREHQSGRPVGRIRSIIASPRPPSGANIITNRRSAAYDYQEQDYADTVSVNPGFADASGSPPSVNPATSLPFLYDRQQEQVWGPPVRLPIGIPTLGEQASSPFAPPSMDATTLRKLADRISITRNSPLNGTNSRQADNEWHSRISQRLQTRGFDTGLGNELATHIAMFTGRQSNRDWTKHATSEINPQLAYSPEGQPLGRQLRNTIARARMSIKTWGEDRPATSNVPQSRHRKLICDNPIVDVLMEYKEKRENIYSVRVVPFRRLFFFIGLVTFFAVLLDFTVDPMSVRSIKLLVFDSMLSLLVSDEFSLEQVIQDFDFETFDAITSAVNSPLQAYADLTFFSFMLLWVVFGFFLSSFVVEIVSTRLVTTQSGKRRGIKYARLLSFAQLPFLFVAVILPSSADYVTLSLGGIAQVVPLCADDFDNLVFSVASNLFGLAMGGLLAIQTMLVLLLVVPAVQRALAFVIAKEVFDLKQVPSTSNAYVMGEKRLKIARLLWRSIPFMSPILLYIPTILVAQVIAEAYASVCIYVFYLLPVASARLRWSDSTQDQVPYRWILFATVWTGLYFAPLSMIGLVETIKIGFDRARIFAQLLLTNPLFYATILAEVCLAVVVMSDVLYMFIASDQEDVQVDQAIDRFMEAIQEEAIQEEATSNRYGNNIS